MYLSLVSGFPAFHQYCPYSYCVSFLEDIDKIASRSYTPSEEDIARVCSSTGIQEYRIKFWQIEVLRGDPNGPPSEQHMCLYDIGSSRMARQAWVPYFEGVDAVMVCKCIIVSVSPTQRLIVRSIPVVVCKSPQHRINPIRNPLLKRTLPPSSLRFRRAFTGGS
jgi:hypothetical protein